MKAKCKAKKFDCVAMKRKAQEKLMAEYEMQQGNFASYSEFIRARAEQSPLWRKLIKARAGRKASAGRA